VNRARRLLGFKHVLRIVVTTFAFLAGLVLVVPALLLVLPFWGFSALIRALAARMARRSAPWDAIIEFAPQVGWKQKPNLRSRHADRSGDSWTVLTDSEGWPGSHRIEESDVLVFGDSFAFGYGVDTQDAYFSQSRRCRIKSVGSPGYNMVQGLLWMRRYADRLHGKTIVWFICTENDLAENLKPYTSDAYPTPFLRGPAGEDEWEVIWDHVEPKKGDGVDRGISNVTLFAYLCTPCPYADRAYAAARHLIRKAHSLCQAQAAHLVVLSIPYKKQLSKQGLRELRRHLRTPDAFDPGYLDHRLAMVCGDVGVPFIAGTEHLTLADYKPRDGHWTIRGNRRVGEIIEEYYCRTQAVRGQSVNHALPVATPVPDL
jgi:hypothetical protein